MSTNDSPPQGLQPAASGPRLWLWNILLAALLHLRFLRGIDPSGAEASLFIGVALVTNAFVLSLIPAGLSGLVGLLLRRQDRVRRVLVGLIWTLFLSALWLDANVWGLFRYHINGMVWATITNSAAGDAIHISTWEFVKYGLLACVVWGLQVFWLGRLDERRPLGFKPGNRVVFLAVLLPLTVVEKGIYARANLLRDRRVTTIARVLPLYQRLTVKKIAIKHFGYDPAAQPQLDLSADSSMLNYPLSAPVFGEPLGKAANGGRPNIAIFVIDSLRGDAYTEELMPVTTEFARRYDARVFEDHFSAGNGTRFGIFGMLYSLYGSYWMPVLTEETSPVLIDSLLGLGYDIGVFSSASMNYPEFRQTAWVRVPEAVHDDMPALSSSEKDTAQVEALGAWMEGREGDRPFFLFSLLDSPHQIYSFPTEDPPYVPYTEHVDYTGLSSGASEQEQLELRNSYKNAVRHADAVLGEMLAVLEANGELDDTIVIVTGDHGEELWEHGFFGHTSNFTDVQLHVPLVMAGPGVVGGVEVLPTSHLDLVPTLLELLGADGERRGDWATGGSLFEPEGAERRRISSNWDLLGLHAPEGVLVVPTNTHRGFVEGWNADWTPMIEDGELVKREGGVLGQLALECRKFLR